MLHFKNADLLHGPVYRGLLYFAVPLFITSLVQLLFNTADMLFAGNFLGTDAGAAIGSSGSIVFFLINLLLGFSTGASVVISQHFGSGNKAGIQKTLQNAVFIAIILGVILTAVGFFISPSVLLAMNIPLEIFSEASVYIQIYCVSILFTALYDTGFSALRAVGNSRAPLVYLFIGGVVNVILDALFIIVFDFGIAGLAWATVLAQIVIVLLVFRHLMFVCPDNVLRLEGIHPDKRTIAEIIRIGLPVSMQSVVITLSNIIIMSQINLFGTDVVAAFSYFYKIENVAWLTTTAFGSAAMIFVGQNIGAKNIQRVREGTKKAMFISMAITGTIGFSVFFLGDFCFGLFTSDPNVVPFGLEIIAATMPFYSLYSIIEVVSGALKGMGKTFAAMTIILLTLCAARTVILLGVMAVYPTVVSVSLVYPVTWVLAALSLLFYYHFAAFKPKSSSGKFSVN